MQKIQDPKQTGPKEFSEKKFWYKNVCGPKKFCVKKYLGLQSLVLNYVIYIIKAPQKLGPKVKLSKIGSITAEILLIWTNVMPGQMSP